MPQQPPMGAPVIAVPVQGQRNFDQQSFVEKCGSRACAKTALVFVITVISACALIASMYISLRLYALETRINALEAILIAEGKAVDARAAQP